MATIAIGVAGGVAAFKAPIVVRECQRTGYDVYVATTRVFLDLAGRSTWEDITSRPVAVDIAGEEHAEYVELTRVTDLIIVVPATANSLTHLAAGFTDDVASLTVLASDALVVAVPAIHSSMWLTSVTQTNVQALHDRGFHVIDPAFGALGSGDRGVDRLLEPEEVAWVTLGVFAAHDQALNAFADCTVAVTTGGIREPASPVCFLSNKSPGRQGLAITSAGARVDASVCVIAANTELVLLATLPTAVQVMRVRSTLQVREATIAQVADADALVVTAVATGFRPEAASKSKIKKDLSNEEAPTIRLVHNSDVLVRIRHSNQRPSPIVGFAVETGTSKEIPVYDVDRAAQKDADFICLNRVGEGVGFSDVPNDTQLLDARGNITSRYAGSRNKVATGLVGHITSLLDNLKR